MTNQANPPGAQPQPKTTQRRSVLGWITEAGMALLIAAAMVLMGKPQDQ